MQVNSNMVKINYKENKNKQFVCITHRCHAQHTLQRIAAKLVDVCIFIQKNGKECLLC